MMIEAKNIGYRLPDGTWLWRGLSFTLHRGHMIGLLGRNGSGKTTLVRTLAGLLRPHEGRVSLSTPIGYVPQRSQITFPFTARDVVAMGRVRHVRWLSGLTAIDRRAVDEAMDRVGVSHLAHRSFLQLSGGERQLVLIARTMSSDCGALLLDEPFAGLDLDNQSRTLTLLRELACEPGLGVLFSAHQPDHLFAAAQSALILQRGEPALFGPCAEILNAPRLTQVYGVDVRVIDVARGDTTTRHAVADLIT
jgi:iron complex transport system ATP-binding protein